MGSLAGLLREAGHRVTGSDEGVYPPMSTLLDEMGIVYTPRFDPANLEPQPDLVVVGNAISRGNPELEAALDARLRYASSAEVLRNEFLEGVHVLAVAGTHGKTTTSALLAWILESAGLNPGFLIGGVSEDFGTSFRLTRSEHFVIEADEYDTAYFDKGPKMWHYRPTTAVVTNVEFDHADIYRDHEAYRFAFARFINLVPRVGTLVVGWGSPVARDLSRNAFCPVESFAAEVADSEWPQRSGAPQVDFGGASAGHPRWQARDIRGDTQGTSFSVQRDGGDWGPVQTRLSGIFNVENCLAAIASASAVGVDDASIRGALSSFRGVRRRMEIRGEVGGVTVVDDFAHHPTSVRAVISAARERFPAHRIVAVFEPRSYTAQRKEFQEGYREALGTADRVILAGLFHPERYDEETGMNPDLLVRSIGADGVPADHIPDVDRIVLTLVGEASPGDVLLLLSNGGFGDIHQKLIDALSA